MPRRKAPPRRNEGVGVEATSTPPPRKKSRSGTRHLPLAQPVEVAIRERRPEDVVVASLEGVAVDAAYADDALLGPSCTRALVRPASNDHASFEWARRSATTTAEPNAAEDDEKDDVQDETRPLAWCRYAFPAKTLACSANESSARDKKNGETLLECFLALLKEGALAVVFAKSSEEDAERVPSRRADVCAGV